MREYNEIKTDFSNLLQKGITEAENLGYENSAKTLKETKEHFDKKDLLVVSAGEVKRGKSSNLESLIEEDGLFPIDVNVCTNIVTIVRYGETEKITAIIEEIDDEGNASERAVNITREQIPEYASEKYNKDNEKNVRCLNIEIPNEKLKQGLVFVDTPGVGSLNIAHAEITYGFLPETDVLLFVSDASSPLTETELKFLETAYKHCKNIIFIVTKIDKFPNYDIVVADNRAKISKQLGMDENKIVIIPVSNTSKKMYLKTKNEEFYNLSNFKLLEKLIWQTVSEKRANILISPFLAIMAKETNTIKKDLQLKYNALASGNVISQEIADKLNATAEEIKKLQDGNAKWRTIIGTELNKLSSQISNNKIVQLQQELNEYIAAQLPVGGMSNPKISKSKRENILSYVNSRITETVYDIKQTLMNGTTDLCMRINKELGLDMSVDNEAFDDIEFDPKTKLVLPKPNLPPIDKAMTIGRNTTFGTAGGASFGTIAGGIIGGTIGLMGGPGGVYVGAQIGAAIGGSIGGAIGGAKGICDARRVIKGETVGDIRTSLSNYINKSLASIRNMVSNTIYDLSSSIPLSFQEQLKEKTELLTKTSKEIKEGCTLSPDEVEKRKNELKGYATKIVELEQEMVAIAKEIKM